jgi:hypothetical protein
MLFLTRACVSGEMLRLPLRTYDTVLGDTPASLATSMIVGLNRTYLSNGFNTLCGIVTGSRTLSSV